jgi:hypothetical protein
LPASSSAAISSPGRCREAGGAIRASIGEAKPRGGEPTGEPDDLEIAQPFAVEIGDAVALGDGFAIAALRSRAGGTGAVVAMLASTGALQSTVDLGRIHGDVEPPRLAKHGKNLFVAVSDDVASKRTLRLGMIQPAGKQPGLVWGGELSQDRDASSAFDIALSGARGVLVWDEPGTGTKEGGIRLATFDSANPGTVTVPRTVASERYENEMPQVVERPSGYWLAWVASGPRSMPAGAHAPRVDVPRAADAGPREDEQADPKPVIEMGNRWLQIVALDGNGSPIAAPRAITARDRHVLVFDLAPSPNGAALLAWRDDDTTPGVESRIVHLARVSLDGNVERALVDDEAVGAGAPSLVADPSEDKLPGWLVLESVTDETRLAALTPSGSLLDALAGDPLIKNGDVLAANRGTLLVARPRGLSAELSLVRCKAAAVATR